MCHVHSFEGNPVPQKKRLGTQDGVSDVACVFIFPAFKRRRRVVTGYCDLLVSYQVELAAYSSRERDGKRSKAEGEI